MTDLGFDGPLYILPFDHRGSFQSGLFGWKGTLTSEQTNRVAASKAIIYEGLLAAVAGGVPKAHAGILVDEQFGAVILRDARARGFLTAVPAEKSGQHEFDFEYGDDYARHIEAFAPTFCKVLVRYNPEGDADMNRRQAGRLLHLSEYLHRTRRKFMFELLVPALRAAGSGPVSTRPVEIAPSILSADRPSSPGRSTRRPGCGPSSSGAVSRPSRSKSMAASVPRTSVFLTPRTLQWAPETIRALRREFIAVTHPGNRAMGVRFRRALPRGSGVTSTHHG